MTTKEKNKHEILAEIRERRAKNTKTKQRRSIHRRIVALVILAAITAVTLGIVYSASAKEITITEINEFTGLNESQTVIARGGNVEDVLKEQGLDIGEHDRLNVPVDKSVDDVEDIVITRGKQVTIKIGDTENVATVTKADITDALVEAGYAPGAYDNVKSDGDTIELISVSHVDELVTETISRNTEYVDDPNLPKGKEVIVDEGEDGLKEIKHKVTYTNGEETERVTVSESVAEEPRNKVIARGTAEPTPAPQTSSSSVSDDGGTVNGYRYTKKYTMTATAYSTDPSENAGYSVSAMGNPLGYGIAAVDPNVIPLGSKIYVTAPDGSWSYGVASAEDTGGAIKGNKIDLCYPTNAMAFGRRSCVVYVLE